jgi:hypothetical protein
MAVRSIPTIASTGLTCVVRVFSAGQVYEVAGTAFEAWNQTDADDGDYDITATEQGTSGIFNWTEPAAVAALDEYEAYLYETVSGALVGTDHKTASSGGGGAGDATAANQTKILTILQSQGRD